jgi:hypothetical protein
MGKAAGLSGPAGETLVSKREKRRAGKGDGAGGPDDRH